MRLYKAVVTTETVVYFLADHEQSPHSCALDFAKEERRWNGDVQESVVKLEEVGSEHLPPSSWRGARVWGSPADTDVSIEQAIERYT
jgi:hypothetical protein